jgi:hypothetical protein
MALKESGVRLIAEGFQEYMRKLAAVNKAQQETFSAQPGKEMKKGADKATQGTDMLAKAMSTAAKAAKVLGVAMLGIKLANFAKESALVSARNETLGVVLGQVGKNAGFSAEQTAFALQSVKDMGITTSAATQSLIQMAQANIDWANSSKLARLAQDAAVIANINSSEAFERLVTATQRGSVLMLRTMGLNVSFQKSYKDLAKEIGVATGDLTEQQRATARLNAVMASGEQIAGAYEAAMGTVGKQLTSLPRHIEEAKAAIGETFKPLLALRVELETKFWKALKDTAPALQGWGEILAGVVEGLQLGATAIGDFIKKSAGLQESDNLMTELAKNVHRLSQGFVLAAAEVAGFFGAIATGVAAIEGGPEALAKWADSFGEIRKQIRDAALLQAFEQFPSIAKTYEELSEEADVAAVSMDRGTSAIERQTAALEEQRAALEQRVEVLRRVEDIALKFEEDLADEAERFAKEKAKFTADAAKKEAQLTKKLNDRLLKLDRDAAKKEAEIIQDFNKQRIEEEKARNMALEQERRRFMLTQAQELRRFQLEEGRLRAEGDILGLIRLREDFDLRQKEAQENRDLELKEGQESVQAQQRQEAEDLQARLQELRQATEERRQEVITSFQQEFAEMQKANLEQRQEMERAHMERLEDARRARDEDLADLGRSLNEQGKITQEGMTAVAAEIAKVFGDQGAADALMRGWSARSESIVAGTIGAITAEIEALNAAISSLEETGTLPPTVAPTRRLRQPELVRRRPLGMREGGSGVVTGPATFAVEPGVTEAFSFVPLPVASTVNVQMSGGFDIRGAEGASPGTVDAAVEGMVVALEDAVNRIQARRGR